MFNKKLTSIVFGAILSIAPIAGLHAETTDIVNAGATPTAVPFNFMDPATGKLDGVMIDVAKAVGKKAGFKANVMSISFSSLVPALQTNKIDFISSAFSKSAEREKVVDFTDTVFNYGEGIVVPESNSSDYKTLKDLKDKKVVVQIGVIYVDPLKEAIGEKNVKMYDSMNDMINDVTLGRIDIAMGDGPIMSYIVNEQKSEGVKYVESYEPSLPTTVGLAVRKGDTERLETLNKALSEIKQDGTLSAILDKWNIKTN